MSIFPLPVFETDADPHHRNAMSDEEIYARLKPPSTIVVRFGRMKLVGEFPYNGEAKPGCGTRLVIRTHRGTEMGEMLTTTCENAGCSKSVTRSEMLDYIENSGGGDYPFHTDGQVLRVATIEDMNKQREIEANTTEYVREAKLLIAELSLPMKLVDVEPILGGELLTFFFTSEQRVDFREMVRRLAGRFKTRIEMRQVGARDEARLVADYERCGQYCCCKNFLKVLKPVSMRSAKIQKATLDPLKISGRCGRLMCCLRYEDKTYDELRKALPKNNTRVGTREGPGRVVDSKILVQLVLVRLDESEREIAVPVEELMDPETCPRPGEVQQAQLAEEDPLRGMPASQVRERTERDQGGEKDSEQREGRRRRGRRRRKSGGQGDQPGEQSSPEARQGESGERPRRRRRRRPGSGEQDSPGDHQAEFRERNEQGSDAGGTDSADDGRGEGRRRRGRRGRRRRRRRGGGEDGGGETSGDGPREPQ